MVTETLHSFDASQEANLEFRSFC